MNVKRKKFGKFLEMFEDPDKFNFLFSYPIKDRTTKIIYYTLIMHKCLFEKINMVL